MSKNKKTITPGGKAVLLKPAVTKSDSPGLNNEEFSVEINDVYGAAPSYESMSANYLAALSTISRLETENTDLKDKLKAITLKITELLLTLDFPAKITWWWALSNTSKLLTFFKGVIDIIKGK